MSEDRLYEFLVGWFEKNVSAFGSVDTTEVNFPHYHIRIDTEGDFDFRKLARDLLAAL